jgi:hypothetical protein
MKQYYTVATKRSPMNAEYASIPSCSHSAYCFLPIQLLLAFINGLNSFVISKDYGMTIINIYVNRMPT